MTTKNKKEVSAALRIFHWLNALTVLLILLTVFTRKNWLEKFKIKELILEFAEKNQIEMQPDMALQLAKLIRNEIWNFHYYLGIFLAFLLLYRLVLLMTKDGMKVFKEAFTIFKPIKSEKSGIKILYVIFYLALVGSVVTGLMMYFAEYLGLSDSTETSLESLHLGIVTLIIYFVPLHIVGVIIAELGNDKGIVSKMINGGKQS